MTGTAQHPPACPSSRPEIPDAEVFGIVLGTPGAPGVRYLDQPIAVPDALRMPGAPVGAAEFLRISAPCAEARCRHFDGARCRLGASLARDGARRGRSGAAPGPPSCAIRPRCRWWREQGPDACVSCAFVVTDRLA